MRIKRAKQNKVKNTINGVKMNILNAKTFQRVFVLKDKPRISCTSDVH